MGSVVFARCFSPLRFGFSLAWLIVVAATAEAASSATGEWLPNQCIILQKRCRDDINCFGSLLGVNFACKRLLHGQGDNCTLRCRQMLTRFIDDDALGREMKNCSCLMDAVCLTHRSRLLNCYSDVWPARGKPSCSRISARCNNDTTCYAAMERFIVACTHLISGVECNAKCEVARQQLYGHPMANDLMWACACDGTPEEEQFCRGVRQHTLALCLSASPVTTTVTTKAAYRQNGTASNGDVGSTGDRRCRCNWFTVALTHLMTLVILFKMS